MAIRELDTRSLSELQPLLNAVKAELRRSKKQRKAKDSPVIFKSKSGLPQYSHYYVVWDQFEGYGDLIRTDIILQAIEDVLGQSPKR